MDIVAITETSEREDISFLTNVEIEGYGKYHTASKSSKGGTAIYVKNNFDTIECCDLNISNVEFETTWIKIKNKNSKNIVCGSIYRHPHNNFDEFYKYFEMCLGRLANENKELYICGDFNLDLLKIDTDHFSQYFFNLLCSYGLLPHILQPTRVTGNTATVIDNIFSNVFLTLSEHFSQFVSVNREKLSSKRFIFIGETILSFEMRVLEMMYQSKIGTALTQMSMIHLKTSIRNLKVLLTDMLH